MIPDFSEIGLDGPASTERFRTGQSIDTAQWRAGVAAGDRQGRRRGALGDARGHRGQAALHRRRPGRPRLPGHLPRHRAVPARPVPDDVREPALDDPPVRRVLHRRGVQRLLPPQPGRRAEGPVGRVRPGHPPRLRQRPPAGDRRRRHGRRGDRLDLRHAAAVRGHPAGPDVGLDDHERRGAAGARALHRGRRGAGRPAGEAGRDHPERHPQRVHGPQHLHLPAAALDADHLRHLRLHLAAHAAVQLHLHLRLPHPGGRRHRRPGAGLHPGRRRRVPAGRPGRGARRRRVRPAAVVLLGHRDELLHGDRQAARGPAAVGQAGEPVRAEEHEVALAAHALARPPAGRSRRRTCTTTSCAPASRRWRPRRATPSRCTPTPSTRRWPCRPTSPPASPATRSSSCSRSRAPAG